jgi:hypothetical protein
MIKENYVNELIGSREGTWEILIFCIFLRKVFTGSQKDKD